MRMSPQDDAVESALEKDLAAHLEKVSKQPHGRDPIFPTPPISSRKVNQKLQRRTGLKLMEEADLVLVRGLGHGTFGSAMVCTSNRQPARSRMVMVADGSRWQQ